MDNYSLETVDFTNRLTTELRQAEDVSRKSGQPLRAPVPYVSNIGFETIPNAGSRQAFLNVATNFDLPAEQVEGLIYVGCNLVKRDPIFSACWKYRGERAAPGAGRGVQEFVKRRWRNESYVRRRGIGDQRKRRSSRVGRSGSSCVERFRRNE